MITAWTSDPHGLTPRAAPVDPASLGDDVLWLDLLNPTPEEDQALEAALGFTLPNMAEMMEIETSSRLYRTSYGTVFTSTHLSDVATDHPTTTPVSYILTPKRLVTLRFSTPLPFKLFIDHAGGSSIASPDLVLVGLMETTIGCLADLLEKVNADLDKISNDVFRFRRRHVEQALQGLIASIGASGRLASKVRESLVDKHRLLNFAEQESAHWSTGDGRQRVQSMLRDIQSLSDHASFIEERITFLLDATLGMISIEQNRVIKIFSIVAVIFMPPTLIASIYGMNFRHGMIELDWSYGYLYALFLMVVSVACTLWFFRRRNWL